MSTSNYQQDHEFDSEEDYLSQFPNYHHHRHHDEAYVKPNWWEVDAVTNLADHPHEGMPDPSHRY